MNNRGFWRALVAALLSALPALLRGAGQRPTSPGNADRPGGPNGARGPRAKLKAPTTAPKPGRSGSGSGSARAGMAEETITPGQFGAGATRDLSVAEIATIVPEYEPSVDGDPDPGEVVWTWVPYAENDGRGKDRPVLIIARIGRGVTAGCYLSTKQHRGFVSVGTGGWDSQGRESFLATERVLRVTDEGMRREGHVLDRDRFVDAVAALARVHRLGGTRP